MNYWLGHETWLISEAWYPCTNEQNHVPICVLNCPIWTPSLCLLGASLLVSSQRLFSPAFQQWKVSQVSVTWAHGHSAPHDYLQFPLQPVVPFDPVFTQGYKQKERVQLENHSPMNSWLLYTLLLLCSLAGARSFWGVGALTCPVLQRYV